MWSGRPGTRRGASGQTTRAPGHRKRRFDALSSRSEARSASWSVRRVCRPLRSPPERTSASASAGLTPLTVVRTPSSATARVSFMSASALARSKASSPVKSRMMDRARRATTSGSRRSVSAAVRDASSAPSSGTARTPSPTSRMGAASARISRSLRATCSRLSRSGVTSKCKTSVAGPPTTGSVVGRASTACQRRPSRVSTSTSAR